MNDLSNIGVDLSSRESVLYFAYGGNMDAAQITGRCREVPQVVGVARLADHVVAFHGRDERWDGGEETVRRQPGAGTWGVVYRLSATAFDRLDAWQGVRLDGTGTYFHSPADVVSQDGTAYSVMLYRKSSLGNPHPPSTPHLAMILAAARRRGLPDDHIAALGAQDSIEPDAPVPRAARADRFLAAAPNLSSSCAC
ncbi:gamma-glutamylcyclotransferase family protein [Xanthobacter sediminis]